MPVLREASLALVLDAADGMEVPVKRCVRCRLVRHYEDYSGRSTVCNECLALWKQMIDRRLLVELRWKMWKKTA